MSRPRSVLVVDDDVDQHVIVRALLGHFGYATHHADTVDEAREILRAHSPDLILLDVHLRAHQGLDLLYALRASGDRVPVVVCTGDALASSRYPAAVPECAAWLLKPLLASDLLPLIERLIGPP